MTRSTYRAAGLAFATAMLGTTALSASANAWPDPAARMEIGVDGLIITPGSSIAAAGDAGKRAHTNIKLLRPAGQVTPFATSPSGYRENPLSLACLYRVVPYTVGCNPQTLTTLAHGGSKVIAIVDAYHYPTATADLQTFSAQYGLPAITSANFQVVYGTSGGVQPPQDSSGGWELEEALDVQMAHALAPRAKVVLVEAKSSSLTDLLYAENVASGIVAAAGGGEVSNSWGSGEFAGEVNYESYFSTASVVYFASSGDSPGTEFPSVLQHVVGVGGTSVNRDSTGAYRNQSVWNATGGGLSTYVAAPAYQSAISGITGTHRGVPDLSLVANPATGVWIYDSTPYSGSVLQWLVIGGTSVASPLAAAVVNASAHFYPTTADELTTVYANLGTGKNFTDVTKGTCNNGSSVLTGWDYCTGVGFPVGRTGK